MRYFAIPRADGGVSVVCIVGGDLEKAVEKWKQTAEQSWLPARDPVEIDPSDLPGRRWRSAWVFRGGRCHVDEGRAREARAKELLRLRDKRLERLAEELAEAQDDEDKEAERLCRQRRKALRRLAIDLTNVRLADLADYLPEELR